jgi:hypothetical protein
VPFRALTRLEYVNTVRDLLGDTSVTLDALPPENQVGRFTRNADDRNVNEPAVDTWRGLADQIATRAVRDRLAALVRCTPKTPADETACGHQFIATFAPRAFRRPVTDGARVALEGLFDGARAAFGFADAIGMTLQAILQSPYFLYHVEGTAGAAGPDGVARLDGFALAARLAYFLTAAPPDDRLWTAAQSGKLDSAEALRTEAARLMAGDGFKAAIWDFHRQWLRADAFKNLFKAPDAVKGWPAQDARNAALEESLRAFVAAVFGRADATVRTLLSSPALYLPPELAPFYSDGPRYGLLTQPAVLSVLANTNQSSPVKRGHFVLESLLCIPLQVPDDPEIAAAAMKVPELSKDSTTRERFAGHAANPACAPCHVVLGMDDLGMAFENYDTVGRYRTQDAGKPVDASGRFPGFSDPALRAPFANAGELVDRLTRSPEVRACLVRQWYEFALGRSLRAGDVPSIDWIAQGLGGGGPADAGLRDLLQGLVLSEPFRTRSLAGVKP